MLSHRYQFQSFAQYRGKLAMKSPQELTTLRASDDVWSVLGVLNYLQALVDKSGIVAELSSPGGCLLSVTFRSDSRQRVRNRI